MHNLPLHITAGADRSINSSRLQSPINPIRYAKVISISLSLANSSSSSTHAL